MTTPASPITTITGTTHPLVSYLRKAARNRRAAVERYADTAKQILRHQALCSESDEGVYEVTGWSWRYVGPAEQHRHLADQRGYVATTARGGYEALALKLAGFPTASQERAEKLHTAAWEATPLIACALGTRLAAGNLDWDTGESVSAAALRLARDAAWSDPFPVFPSARDVYAVVAGWLGVGGPAETGAAYLSAREEITATLNTAGINWGGARLTARQAADRAGLAASTWRAHVSRGEAPASDDDGLWPVAVVDAWRHSRPRIRRIPGW